MRTIPAQFVMTLAVSAFLGAAAPVAGEGPEPAPTPSPTPAPQPSAAPTPAPTVGSGLPIKLGASVTVRSDTIDVEDQNDLLLDDNRESAMRARVRLWAEYRDASASVSGGLRLSAGETPNPAGSFPRLGNALRPETFGLDQFYVSLRPFQNREAAALTAGKMPLPFWRGDKGTYRSQMVWDHDISPVGVTLRNAAHNKDDDVRVENLAGYFVLEDISESRFSGLVGKTYLFADQLHFRAPHVGLAVAFYDYENLNAGLRSPNFTPGQGAFVAPGTNAFLMRPGLQVTNNAVNYGPGANGFVEDQFRVLNVIGQLNVGLPFFRGSGRPQIFVLGDYAHNSSVGRDGDGYYLVAGIYGGGWKESTPRPYGIHFAWGNVDADSTLGTFANSDLGAGTDYRGWEVSGNYRFTRNLLFAVTYFDYDGHPRKDSFVRRLFVDLVWDF